MILLIGGLRTINSNASFERYFLENFPDIVRSIHSEELGRESFLFSSFFILITREPVLSFTGDETFLTGFVLSTFLMRRPAISELFLEVAAEFGFDI